MSSGVQFLWLVGQAWRGLVDFPRLSAAIFGLLVASALVQKPFRHVEAWRIARWSAVPFGIPVLVLFVGLVFASDTSPSMTFESTVVGLVQLVVVGLLLAHIAIGVAFARRFRSMFAYIAALTLAQLWLSFCAALVALMSASGEWP